MGMTLSMLWDDTNLLFFSGGGSEYSVLLAHKL